MHPTPPAHQDPYCNLSLGSGPTDLEAKSCTKIMRLKVTYCRVSAASTHLGSCSCKREKRRDRDTRREEDMNKAQKIATWLLLVLGSQLADARPLVPGSRVWDIPFLLGLNLSVCDNWLQHP